MRQILGARWLAAAGLVVTASCSGDGAIAQPPPPYASVAVVLSHDGELSAGVYLNGLEQARLDLFEWAVCAADFADRDWAGFADNLAHLGVADRPHDVRWVSTNADTLTYDVEIGTATVRVNIETALESDGSGCVHAVVASTFADRFEPD